MTLSALILLLILFFIMSAIGVVTGSNSLVTVPVMFQFGIEPKIAVATNMFGLAFMNIGATLPFLKKDIIDYKKLSPLIILTLISSALGAMLVGFITDQSIKVIVIVGMICVALFTLIKRDAGIAKITEISTKATVLTYIFTFLLGIYGGLYSGGYTTLLTALYVAFFGMTFTEAIAGTKLINIFSSGIATIIFAWQGLIDYKLGIILAVTMFIAAFIGAKTVTKLNDIRLKRIFLGVVFLLALKMLFDFILK
ncbi:MAG: sulfite exporter TauE/SafE family protein [Aridibacter sp.]